MTPPDWLRRAVSTAPRTPAWAATLRSASPAAALSASTGGQRHVEITVDVTPHVQLGHGPGHAAHRGPQVG